jgi:hypothetical protein
VSTEPDNAPAWDGRRAGHYEVWYLTFNHLAARAGFWIRYTLEAPRAGAPHGRLWFAAFMPDGPPVALNQRHHPPSLAASPFAVEIAGSVLHHDCARGAIEGGGHRASWDLRWTPAVETLRHLPGLVYRTRFADTRVLSPNPRIAISGTVEVDGRRFALDGQPGGQSHVWGRRHADAWAWGRCSAFAGEPSALVEAVTVRVRRAGLLLPPLTFLTVEIDGERLSFTSFRLALRARGDFAAGRYAFGAESPRARVRGMFTSERDRLVEAEYSDPGGAPRFCANTEVGDLDLTVERQGAGGAWRPRHLAARGTAHFETGARAGAYLTARHVVV